MLLFYLYWSKKIFITQMFRENFFFSLNEFKKSTSVIYLTKRKMETPKKYENSSSENLYKYMQKKKRTSKIIQ